MDRFFSKNKKYLIITISFFAIILVSVLVYFIYGNKDKEKTGEIKTPVRVEINKDDRPEKKIEFEQPVSEEDIAMNPGKYMPELSDSDNDGLSDKEEKLYGSDPNKFDTDEDGLSDNLEIKAFFTDFKKADTDGDGFLDGDEVRKGFNPNGEGKIVYPIKPKNK